MVKRDNLLSVPPTILLLYYLQRQSNPFCVIQKVIEISSEFSSAALS